MGRPKGLLEELTRYKMCMVIALSYSQEEVHRILSLSTKKRSIRKSGGVFAGPRTFFKRAFVSGWSKAPATFERVTF